MAAEGEITEAGRKFHNSLLKHLNGSEVAAETTTNFIDDAKNAADAVLEPHLGYTERIKIALHKAPRKEIGMLFCALLGGIGCGYTLGIILKKDESKK